MAASSETGRRLGGYPAAVILLLATLAHAACPASPGTIEAALDGAQVAFRMMDRAGFQGATDTVREGLECLGERMSPTLAARVHRVNGLREFFAGNDAGARLAFGAARAIDPAYEFPESIVPAGQPVRALYAEAINVPSVTVAAPRPVEGQVEFDGTPSPNRPSERPTLAVLVRSDRSVAASAYLWPGDPLFPYAAASTASVATAPTSGARKGPNWPLAIAAGASGLLAGGALLAANLSDADFNAMAVGSSEAELRAAQAQTNGLQVAAAGLGVVGLGLGVGAVVAGSW